MGVSVENQRWTSRIADLREVAANVRFLSCGPLLRPLELDLSSIDWVTVGGESGPRSRSMDVAWAREIADQCTKSGTAFFMKQLGTVAGRELGARDRKGGDWAAFPADLRRRELPVR